jgi:hypothetical protein
VKVLLTESRVGESAQVEADLRAAGFEVTGCHRNGAFCRAMLPDGRCPLDDDVAPVDVVVVVRPADLAAMTIWEYGVLCAAAAEVPVIVTTMRDQLLPTIPPGLREITDNAVARGDVVAACYQAASAWPRR